MERDCLQRRRPSQLKEAIQRAQEFAAEQDVPLTAERLAAELDMDLDTFRAIAAGEYPVKSRSAAGKAEMIRHAARQATASVVEHAMRRGSGTNMHLLYLKNNAGYEQGREKTDDKKEESALAPVIFMGEEELSD